MNTSFDAKEIDGVTVVTWTPRTYAGQTDLGGGVTGAQASLVTFARRMLDGSLPLIDGLASLDTTTDPEGLAAARAILRTEWVEFVNELGNEGGPRTFRADDLMFRIRGGKVSGTSVPGHLTEFGILLGMLKDDGAVDRTHVINPAEEADLTNFIVVRDYVAAVDASWKNFKQLQATDGEHNLGSGLVLLSRSLSVVRESVSETNDAMDSVNVGETERLATPLDLPFTEYDGSTGKTKIFLADLQSWIAHFASDEATSLIYDAGKNGVKTIQGTLDKLTKLVAELLKQLDDPTANHLPEGLGEPRVKVAVTSIHQENNDACPRYGRSFKERPRRSATADRRPH